jgi:ferritin-like metal-binding protein YciE
LPDQLLVQLRVIYRAEVVLARDLARWLGQTNWLPLRLVLADHRRNTNRHIRAIGSLLPLREGLGPEAVRLSDDEVDRAPPREPGGPAAAVAALVLQATRVSAVTYRAALDLATARPFSAAATLLSQALTEETETERRLSTMVSEIAGQ